jgi:transcriptional regulator with XRE-family HTH domain
MTKELDYSFGTWMRHRRKTLDLTQPELAERLHCSVNTIKKLETDARRPSKQLAELLASFNMRVATGDQLPAWRTKKPPGASQHQKFRNIPVRMYRQPSLP